jgi:hypothetical protein
MQMRTEEDKDHTEVMKKVGHAARSQCTGGIALYPVAFF